MNNPKIRKYIQSLRALSHSTDDYLFVWDIKNDVNWFFGDIDTDFDIREKGCEYNATQQMLDIVYPKDLPDLKESLGKVKLGESKEHNLTYRWVARDGKKIWINCRGAVIDDEEGAPMVLLGRVTRAPYENLVNKASGLFNRSKMFKDFQDSALLSQSGQMLLLGIDRLMKMFLDGGEQNAKRIVAKFATILEEYVTPSSYVYQVEEDTFALCVPGATEAAAQNIYDALMKAVGGEFTVTGLCIPYGKQYFVNEGDLYRTAIVALLEAKKSGRAKLNFYAQEDIVQRKQSIQLADEIEKSIKNGFKGFYVKYQPLINSSDYSLYGVEALMRFRSERGEFLPAQFIPIMEQSGAIKEAGLWILRTALEQVKEWRKHIPDLRLNVNFSLEQLKDPDVTNSVIKIFNEAGLPPCTLTIELTETMKLANLERIAVIVRAWREAGIEISIDDFGTGYANLRLLKDIACDEIKIERMFVTNLKQGSYSYLLINSLIAFARTNKIRVCCEGVESESDVYTVSELGPEILQGYAFDRPCTQEEFYRNYIDATSKQYQARTKFVGKLNSKKQERLTRFNPIDILGSMNVGLCVMQLDQSKEKREMSPDEVMRKLLGIGDDVSPQACYEYWLSRVKQGYVEYVKESLDKLLTTTNILQFVYPWIHPTRGELLFSCSSKREVDDSGAVTVKGLHRIISGVEKRAYDEKENSLRYSMQTKYIDKILQNAIAYMEINLTDNRLIGTLTDMVDKQPDSQKDKELFVGDDQKINYEAFERWWADRYLTSSKQEFFTICNCEYLISSYLKGQSVVEFYCSGKDKNGEEYDCQKTYYITKDEIMGDVTALCVMYDVSDRTKEKLLNEHKNSVIRAICDEFKSICYVNLDTDQMEFYRQDETLSPWQDGITHTQLVREFASQYVTKSDREYLVEQLSIANIKKEFATKSEFKIEYGRIMPDRTVRRHMVKVMHYDVGAATSAHAIVGVKDIEDVLRREKIYKEALEKVYTDHLTGLLNQQGLSEHAAELMKRKETDVAVIFMDLDNFKSINDMYGHSKGDEFLYRVGGVLRKVAKDGDLVGRYGGDEFVAVITDAKNHNKVIAVAQKIADLTRGLGKEMGLSLDITISIGVAFSSQHGHNYRLLKEIADDRLYLAKKRGKDMIVKNS